MPWDHKASRAREVVIAGDMNTECLVGSCVAALLDGAPQPTASDLMRECASALRIGSECEDSEDAPEKVGKVTSDDQLTAWCDLRRKAIDGALEHRIALSHLETGATRAAYDHGKDCGPCASWCLDHIFYSARNLQLQTSWAALEADLESAAAGLPNRSCPSDHLPIAATFKPLPVPTLHPAKAAELLKQVDALDAQQAGELRLLRDKLAELEPPPSASDTAAEGADNSGGKPAKKNKKTEKPSPEKRILRQKGRSL